MTVISLRSTHVLRLLLPGIRPQVAPSPPKPHLPDLTNPPLVRQLRRQANFQPINIPKPMPGSGNVSSNPNTVFIRKAALSSIWVKTGFQSLTIAGAYLPLIAGTALSVFLLTPPFTVASSRSLAKTPSPIPFTFFKSSTLLNWPLC